MGKKTRDVAGASKLDVFFGGTSSHSATMKPIIDEVKKFPKVPLEHGFELGVYRRTATIVERPITTRNHRILERLADGQASVKVISENLGLPMSVIYRELEYMKELQYVEVVQE